MKCESEQRSAAHLDETSSASLTELLLKDPVASAPAADICGVQEAGGGHVTRCPFDAERLGGDTWDTSTKSNQQSCVPRSNQLQLSTHPYLLHPDFTSSIFTRASSAGVCRIREDNTGRSLLSFSSRQQEHYKIQCCSQNFILYLLTFIHLLCCCLSLHAALNAQSPLRSAFFSWGPERLTMNIQNAEFGVKSDRNNRINQIDLLNKADCLWTKRLRAVYTWSSCGILTLKWRFMKWKQLIQ